MFSEDAHFKVVQQYYDLAPRPNSLDRERLKISLETFGQKEPIKVIPDETDGSLIILDGFTRYELLKELKVPDSHINYEFVDKEKVTRAGYGFDPLDYIRLCNIRKHYNDYQLASVFCKYGPDYWSKIQDKSHNTRYTRNELMEYAKSTQISTRTFQRVARIDEFLRTGVFPSSIRTALNNGELSIGSADKLASQIESLENFVKYSRLNDETTEEEKAKYAAFKEELIKRYSLNNLCANLAQQYSGKYFVKEFTRIYKAVTKEHGEYFNPTPKEDLEGNFQSVINDISSQAHKLVEREEYQSKVEKLGCSANKKGIKEILGKIAAFLTEQKDTAYDVFLFRTNTAELQKHNQKEHDKREAVLAKMVADEKATIENAHNEAIQQAKAYKETLMETQFLTEEEAKQQTLTDLGILVD